jgi:hypothetical protein
MSRADLLDIAGAIAIAAFCIAGWWHGGRPMPCLTVGHSLALGGDCGRHARPRENTNG